MNVYSDVIEMQWKDLRKSMSNIRKSLKNNDLVNSANQNNLKDRIDKIEFKIKDIIDDIEDLQYDLDREDVKENNDPLINRRILDYEKTYDMMKPVLGVALLSYLSNNTNQI